MPLMVADAPPTSSSSSAIWSRRRDEITFDRLHKFWSALSPQARYELLRIDKQTLIEHARRNLYCSRCNGLLLESFTQIVVYGKSLHQEDLGEPSFLEVERDDVQDPSVHPWGGLSTTKDGTLTLLGCFINAKSLLVIQNVFDNARAREHERGMLYPDACGGGGRGWISPAIANYGRGHGTRDTCALHTARLSCDTLVDFWSALGEETRSSLLRMKEEDFIERLMHRFDSKRFCRDCRRNVIREFKELKELKRLRRESRCTSWFCVADTDFQCEVFEDAVLVNWHQNFMEQDGSYHHFEWAIGTEEGKSDIVDFEDVEMNGQIHKKGLDLDQYEDYFVTLRAWRLDGRCTEFSVKAHALKGQSCVHRRMIVGDGFVTITEGESIRSFFEHAEEAEEEDEDDAMDRDGSDPDGDGTHPQKHAKSPELAREFLLDAATVIFKEQVEKAFREGTARQNAHSVFVSLALKLLEERVHVACKEIITLEKQTKLLEEEEKEKREEEERRERRRAKEREKKLRRKERLKEKEKYKETQPVQSKSYNDISFSPLTNSAIPTDYQSAEISSSRYSSSEEKDSVVITEPHSPDISVDESLSTEINVQSNEVQCSTTEEFVSSGFNDAFICEQTKLSSKLRFKRDFPQEQDNNFWFDDCRDDSGDIGDVHWQSRERVRNTARGSKSMLSANNRTRDQYEYKSCSCGHQKDYKYVPSKARSSREMKTARKTVAEKPRLQYRRCYPLDSFIVPKGSRISGTPNKIAGPKQIWEPMDTRKKSSLGNAINASETVCDSDQSYQVDCSKDLSENEMVDTKCEPLVELCSDRSEETCMSDIEQPCNKGETTQAACNNEPLDASKADFYLTKDPQMANKIISDSSSCLSEGDRDSSMSSMTSLSAQNLESSSTSDSEEYSERTNSSPGDPPTKNASCSLLEKCAGNGFREYQPQRIHPPVSKECGFGTAPFQDQVLRNQNVHTLPYSSTFIGFHNHILSVPTNGYIPYSHPGHFYHSPVGYGVTGNQCVDFSMQYNNLHPYTGPEFGYGPARQVYKTPMSSNATPPTPLCRSTAPGVMKPVRQHYHNLLLNKSKLMGAQNSCAEENAKPQEGSAPFSLFQFNLPIAPPTSAKSNDVHSGEALALKPPMAQAQPCSRKEINNVKEYNLFSARTGSVFPFL